MVVPAATAMLEKRDQRLRRKEHRKKLKQEEQLGEYDTGVQPGHVNEQVCCKWAGHRTLSNFSL